MIPVRGAAPSGSRRGLWGPDANEAGIAGGRLDGGGRPVATTDGPKVATGISCSRRFAVPQTFAVHAALRGA